MRDRAVRSGRGAVLVVLAMLLPGILAFAGQEPGSDLPARAAAAARAAEAAEAAATAAERAAEEAGESLADETAAAQEATAQARARRDAARDAAEAARDAAKAARDAAKAARDAAKETGKGKGQGHDEAEDGGAPADEADEAALAAAEAALDDAETEFAATVTAEATRIALAEARVAQRSAAAAEARETATELRRLADELAAQVQEEQSRAATHGKATAPFDVEKVEQWSDEQGGWTTGALNQPSKPEVGPGDTVRIRVTVEVAEPGTYAFALVVDTTLPSGTRLYAGEFCLLEDVAGVCDGDVEQGQREVGTDGETATWTVEREYTTAGTHEVLLGAVLADGAGGDGRGGASGHAWVEVDGTTTGQLPIHVSKGDQASDPRDDDPDDADDAGDDGTDDEPDDDADADDGDGDDGDDADDRGDDADDADDDAEDADDDADEDADDDGDADDADDADDDDDDADDDDAADDGQRDDRDADDADDDDGEGDERPCVGQLTVEVRSERGDQLSALLLIGDDEVEVDGIHGPVERACGPVDVALVRGPSGYLLDALPEVASEQARPGRRPLARPRPTTVTISAGQDHYVLFRLAVDPGAPEAPPATPVGGSTGDDASPVPAPTPAPAVPTLPVRPAPVPDPDPELGVSDEALTRTDPTADDRDTEVEGTTVRLAPAPVPAPAPVVVDAADLPRTGSSPVPAASLALLALLVGGTLARTGRRSSRAS